MTLTKKLTLSILAFSTMIMFQNCKNANFIQVQDETESASIDDGQIQEPKEIDPPVVVDPVQQPVVQTPAQPAPIPTPVTQNPPTPPAVPAPVPVPVPAPVAQSKLGDCRTVYSTTIDGGQGSDSYFGLLVAGRQTIPTLIIRPGDGKDAADITMQQGSDAYKNFALQFSNSELLYIGIFRADNAHIEAGFKCGQFITTTSSVAAGRTYTYNGCSLDTDLISAKLAPGESMLFRAGAFSKTDIDSGAAVVRNFSACVRVQRALN